MSHMGDHRKHVIEVRIPCVQMAQVGNGFGLMVVCGAHLAQFSG